MFREVYLSHWIPLAGRGFYANVQETKEIEIYKDTIRLKKIRRQEVKIAKKTEIKNSTPHLP
jgi:hypothetical protein